MNIELDSLNASEQVLREYILKWTRETNWSCALFFRF